MDDYIGVVVMRVGVGAVIWFFWDRIMGKCGK